VQVNIGRFGPYIAHDKKFYSLSKEYDPYEITLDVAIPLISEKRKAKDERTIKIFEKEKIQLLKGPYGPYIKKGLKNFPIPKEKQDNVQDLSIEEVQAMIEHAIANPTRGKRRAPKK
ncbi:MAG: DNA topoisomerase I, partial [Chitinophagaceae bacterium]|nr:DNA topoisomerase I [Chitinophagaceae bacterium]